MQEDHREIPTIAYTPVGEQAQSVQAPSPQKTMLQEPLESPRHLVWLLLRDPAQLSEAEQQLLSFIRQEQTVDFAYILAQQFVHLMREHRVEELDTWLSTCASSQIPDLETFATGLQKEISAIRAAVTLPYSTGPVEGHVNRLKLIKRTMYNRGSFDLLRRRVLYPASSSDP